MPGNQIPSRIQWEGVWGWARPQNRLSPWQRAYLVSAASGALLNGLSGITLFFAKSRPVPRRTRPHHDTPQDRLQLAQIRKPPSVPTRQLVKRSSMLRYEFVPSHRQPLKQQQRYTCRHPTMPAYPTIDLTRRHLQANRCRSPIPRTVVKREKSTDIKIRSECVRPFRPSNGMRYAGLRPFSACGVRHGMTIASRVVERDRGDTKPAQVMLGVQR